MHRDPTSENSDLYEFKIALFDKGGLEELLLFVKNYKMMLEDLETLPVNMKLHYIFTILCSEALFKFNTLSTQVGSITTTNFNQGILGLGTYLFPVNEF